MTGAAERSLSPRIAALDPDPITRELLALYLVPQGSELRAEGSLSATLVALATTPPDLFFCAEAALRHADAPEREQLRSCLERIPVVIVLEPGEGSHFSGDWPMVRTRLFKPLPLEGVLAVCEAWRRDCGRMEASAAGPDSADPLAGLQALMTQTGMDEAMVGELLESFLDRMPAYLGDIRQALAKQDSKQLERTAHSLKGMCANLRFDGLVSLSDALRSSGIAGDLDGASQCTERLRAEFDRVAAAVHARGPHAH